MNARAAQFLQRQKTTVKEGLDWKGMKVWKIFSDEGCSLELMDDLEAYFSSI
jgi:hypothetical protein